MFKEIKEMIDSTVYPNGNGEVTAQNINLAMQGIVEATEEKITEVENKIADIEENGEENGTGGSGALKVWVNELIGVEDTEEQIAENIATFEALAREEDHVVHLMVVIDEGDMHTLAAVTPLSQQFMVADDGTAIIEFDIETYGDKAFITLRSDGSYSIEPYSPSEGGNGPLRVWINEENTPEQIAENISTYNAIKDKHHENVVLCFEESNGEWEASATMPVTVEYEVVNDEGIAFLETVIASDALNSSKTHVMLVRLYNDGTTEISFQYEQSSGPLRVWLNEANTPEQVAENAATFSALKNDSPTNVVLAIGDELGKAAFSVSYYETGEVIALVHYSQTKIDGSLEATYINVLLNEDGSTEVEYA